MPVRRPKENEGLDLESLSIDALIALRAEVESALADRARELEKQLAVLGVGSGRKRGRPAGTGRGSALKGVKVPPKYRGPNGETWAGRGARPKWLSALLDEGHALAEYAIKPEGEDYAVAAATAHVAKKRGRPASAKRNQ